MINEQLYINNISIPVESALNVALTKAIQDIKEPNKRKATFSKTVTLPDSKVLRQVFDHVFEYNMVDRTFNPLAKADVRYEVSSEVILSGYLQLKKIITLDEEKFSFEVSLVGELANFFEDIKLLKLEDLDLSIYDHILTREVQQESWDSQIIKSGVFVPFNLGEGYVYALVDYGYSTDAVTFSVSDIGTSIYVRQYWATIFAEAGYSWTSTFLDSTLFKSLIIPASPEAYALTSTEIANREFTANNPILTATGTTTSGNLPNLTLSTRDIVKNTTELSDAGGVYDPVTGVFTCINAGLYTFEFTCHINATFVPTDGVTLLKTVSDIVGYIMLHKYDNATATEAQVAASPFYITSSDATFFAGSRSTSTTPTVTDDDYLAEKNWSKTPPPIGLPDYTPVPRTVNPPDEYRVKVTGIEMVAGDRMTPSWKAGAFSPFASTGSAIMFEDSVGGAYTGTCTIDMPVSSYYSKVENTSTYVGSAFEIGKTIPKNIKQMDFILAFVKMYNLFIEIDPANPKNLIIEPRDDFYADTTENIHTLIDRSKPFEQYPVTDLNAIKYIYKYKDDKDYFNELYTARWQTSYGEAQIDVTHDFGKDVMKEELMFSPTPSVSLPSSNRVLPTIQQRDDSGQPISTKHNIRVLHYGGMKTCNAAWNHLLTLGSSAFTIPFPDWKSTYPYAGMWDDPYSPTLSICFGLPQEVFYWSSPVEPIVITTNNLFNTYHSKMIREYTDEDTRIVECYVDMNQVDWAEWDFTKLYYFGTGGNYAYHRLYKVFDYNPSSAETTKVQFLKIKEADIFIPKTDTADGSNDPVDPFTGTAGGQIDTGVGADLPALPATKGADGNYGGGRTQTFNGEYNTVADTAKNVDIQGDNNQVWGDAQDIKLINSNGNTIDGGVRNVTLINTDDKVITESNQVWINGVLTSPSSMQSQNVITTTDAAYTAEDVYRRIWVDTSLNAVTVTLPTAPYDGQSWIIKLIDATNTLTIDTAGTETIDGSATATINNLNTSITIAYGADEDEYKIE